MRVSAEELNLTAAVLLTVRRRLMMTMMMKPTVAEMRPRRMINLG